MPHMEPRTHKHPKPTIDRLSQIVSLVGAVLLLAAIPILAVLVLLGAPGGFLLALPLLVGLSLPLLMRTAVSPTITVTEEGLALKPLIWRERVVAWDAITSVQVFPLLPSVDEEVTRRVAVGRLNYRPAGGLMLVIPGLPPQYRIAGFFAGVASQPIIALTNRAHAEYDTLVEAVLSHTNPAKHADDLIVD